MAGCQRNRTERRRAIYFQLTESLKRRLILELRRYWQYHPHYQDIVEHIQGKYSFEERPQYGIVLKTGGGTRVDLSADNFIGTVISYTYLAKVRGKNAAGGIEYPGVAVEWVREDEVAIQNNGGRFPSPPGVYYIELTQDTEFYVDPLLDVYREQVVMVDSLTARLQNAPLDNTLRLFEMPAGFRLVEGTNYTLVRDSTGKPTGEINLIQALTGGRYLTADYRYPGTSVGPFVLTPSRADNKAIPGVVLAFGRRNKKGDRMAVVVQPTRQPAALEYGGRWAISMDFDVLARDVYACQEIVDQTVIYIWGILRSRLSSEGIELTDLSLGGESEEVYDENADDYFYNASFSLTCETEWSVHVPLYGYIRQATPLTAEEMTAMSGLPDEVVAGMQNNLKMLESLGLEMVVDPFFSGRTSTFEVIR